MELFHKKIDLFKKGPKELSDDELLEEIEKETGISAPKPRLLPPPPSIQKPVGQIPLPSAKPSMQLRPVADIEELKMMEKQEVAKLPLFMRVEEYDKILAEVTRVAESLKTMEDILNSLTKLEEEQTAQTKKWRNQLEITKTQVKQLVAHMPETGKLKELVQLKKQQQQKEVLKKEISGLGEEIRKARPSRDVESVQNELSSMKSDMQREMRNLQEQVRAIADIVKQTVVQQKPAPQQGFPKQGYTKTEERKPW